MPARPLATAPTESPATRFEAALIGRIGFHATASLYAATGLVFTVLIALKWRTDVWDERALANAR